MNEVRMSDRDTMADIPTYPTKKTVGVPIHYRTARPLNTTNIVY